MASSNVSSVVDYFATANEGFATTLGTTISSGATAVPLSGTSGLTNGTVFVGIIEPGATNQQVFTGIVDIADSQISNVVWTRGTNNSHVGGVAIVDYVTGTAFNMMSTGVQTVINQTGGLKSGLTIASPTITSPTISNQTSSGKVSGWVSAGETWAYASSSTITVPTDATTKYDIGDYLQLTQSATVKYFIITGVTSTVLTVAGMTPGSLETVANSTISANSYSSARSPHGLPAGVSGVWQTWAPSYTNLTIGNGAVTAKYTQNGKTVSFVYKFTLGSTSAMGTVPTISLPVAANASYSLNDALGTGFANTNSANSPVIPTLQSATIFSPTVNGAAGTYVGGLSGLTASIPGTWASTNYFTVQGSYEAA